MVGDRGMEDVPGKNLIESKFRAESGRETGSPAPGGAWLVLPLGEGPWQTPFGPW